MATTLGNNSQERERRIRLVGDYIIKTNSSIRKTQKYLKEEYNINISIPTIKDYLEKYKMLIARDKLNRLEEIRYNNSSDSVEKEEVKRRVTIVTNMYLIEKLNIDEIASKLNVSYDVIYRDLTTRLEKTNKDLSIAVKEEMQKRRLNNLQKPKK